MSCTGRSAVETTAIAPDPWLMTGPAKLPAVPSGEDGVTMAAFGIYTNELRKTCTGIRTQTRHLQQFVRKLRDQTEK